MAMESVKVSANYVGREIHLTGNEREVVGAILDARLTPPPKAALPVGLNERTLASDAWRRLKIGEIKEARRAIAAENEALIEAKGKVPPNVAECESIRAKIVSMTRQHQSAAITGRNFKLPSAVCRFIAEACERLGDWLPLTAEATEIFVNVAKKFGAKLPATPAYDGIQKLSDGEEVLTDE